MPRTDVAVYHDELTAGLFPDFTSKDEHFLALALCGEVGELANMVKKRWRDGVDLTPEIRYEIADIRIYLEMFARLFEADGDKMYPIIEKKLLEVVAKRKAKLTGPNPRMIAF